MSPEQLLAMRLDFAKLRTQFEETGWSAGSFTNIEESWHPNGEQLEDKVSHCLMGALGRIYELGGSRFEFRDELITEAVTNEDYGKELEQMIIALGAESRKRTIAHHYNKTYSNQYFKGDIPTSEYGQDKDNWLDTLSDEEIANDYFLGMQAEFIMSYNDNVHGIEFAIPEHHEHVILEEGQSLSIDDPNRRWESQTRTPREEAMLPKMHVYLTKEKHANDAHPTKVHNQIGTDDCTIACARWVRVDQETAIQGLYEMFDHIEKQQHVGV